MTEQIWNDTFPPLNLYNHPSFQVQDVFWEARKIGHIDMPSSWVNALLFGAGKENE